MNVFRFKAQNIKWGERTVLVASPNVDSARKLLPEFGARPVSFGEGEELTNLTWHADEGIIEDFYWEE